MSSANPSDGGANTPNGPDGPETPTPSGIGGYHFDVDRTPDGTWKKWTATELTTGKETSGPSWIVALFLLIILIALDSASDDLPDSDADDPEEVWRELTADTKQRFADEDVTEDEVEDAIEWARS